MCGCPVSERNEGLFGEGTLQWACGRLVLDSGFRGIQSGELVFIYKAGEDRGMESQGDQADRSYTV